MDGYRRLGVVLVLLVIAVLPARAAQWDLAGPGAGLVSQSLAAFAGAVSRDSRGALSLAPVARDDVLDSLAAGKAAAGAFPMALLESSNPVFAMDRVPYLASNFVDAEKLWRVLRPHVENALSSRGLVLLYAVVAPPPAPVSGRPLTELTAWRGTRLVSTRPALDDLSRILGAQVVHGLSARDALLGRKADVAFIDPHAAAADGAWQYASHYLDAPAWFPKHLVVARRDALDALDGAARAAIVAAAREAEAEGWRVAAAAAGDGVQKLRDYGVKTAQPPVGLLIRLEALGRELLFLWSDTAGEEGARLVEDYYAIR